jgi:TRAP-type C4-dicarboxylate transport system permease small subunit
MSDEISEEDEPLSASLGWFGTLDTAVYQVEIVVVVLALIIMSVIVFTDVVYQLTFGLQQSLGRGDAGAWAMMLGILAFVGAMCFAISRGKPMERTADYGGDDEDDPEAESAEQEEREERPMGVRIGITAGMLAAIVGVSISLVYLQSSTVYRIMTLVLTIPVGIFFYNNEQHTRLGILAVAVATSLYFMGALPEGYSWSQSYGLFLLLWVGFLGASAAARERRHLRVDLMRKLLSPKWLPHFNALSYLVAAVFTGIIFYLGFIYLFGKDSAYLVPIWEVPEWLPGTLQEELKTFPLPEDASVFTRMLHVLFAPTEPGEVPDWLKVLAIPVSMALIVIRFLGHSFAFARMAVRGEEYEDIPEAH